MPTGPDEVTIGINTGLFSISGRWKPSRDEQNAAWEMYVELVTRISIEELQPDHGSTREALTSLYSLFASTRDILRRYGPSVAKPDRPDDITFGRLAVTILNDALRPFLSTWHPALEELEAARPQHTSRSEHERAWSEADRFYQDLAQVREVLTQYAHTLAHVVGITPLHGP